MKLLEQSQVPSMHRPWWHDYVGEQLTQALLDSGLLLKANPTTWYPCGGPRDNGCPRFVIQENGRFVAVCGRTPKACPELVLTEDELCPLEFSHKAFVHALRRGFAITGKIDADDVDFPNTTRIGDRAGRAVYLALSPAYPGFESWLGSRGEALVLVPSARRIATKTFERFNARNETQLVALSNTLRLVSGRLVGTLGEELLWAKEPTADPAVCVVVDQDGRRTLSSREYQQLVAHADEYDLFIDTTVTIEGGGHRGGRRTGTGEWEEVSLTKHEAAVLVELITTRKALRTGDFKTVSVNHVGKTVEHARKKIDLSLRTREWRSIHTLPGDVREAKRWVFNPAPSIRWAALIASSATD